MDFLKQVSNAKVTKIVKPKYILTWDNSENGRDLNDTYERKDNGFYIEYINQNNRQQITRIGQPFFDTLEEIYKSASHD